MDKTPNLGYARFDRDKHDGDREHGLRLIDGLLGHPSPTKLIDETHD